MRTTRAPAPHLLRWSAGAVLWMGAAWLIYLVAVRTASGQLLDTMMRATADGTGHVLPELDPENHWIAVWILGPPGIALLGLLASRPRRLRQAAATSAAIVLAGANLTTQLFKALWNERPALVLDLAPEWTANSLPSGHTTMAASAAAAVFLVAAPRSRPLWAGLGALWAGGWGGYIFIEGWHRPSDMIAAHLVTAAWTALAGCLLLQAERRARVSAAMEIASYPDAGRHGPEFDDADDAGRQPTAAERLTAALTPPLRDGRRRGGRSAGLCLTLGLAGCTLAVIFLLGPIVNAPGSFSERLAESASGPTPWLFLAGAALSSAPAFFPAAAGILSFSSASAGEHPHHAGR